MTKWDEVCSGRQLPEKRNRIFEHTMQFMIVLTCLLGIAASETTQIQPIEKNDTLTVTLFYESYCPGCIQFLGTELLDAWNTFKTNISIDLVPYGGAHRFIVHGHLKFTCQHGPEECLGNKLHACAILQACGQGGSVSCKSADKMDHVIHYIHCVEQQPDQMEASDNCAKQFHLDGDDIKECAQSSKGDNLLDLYGNRTTSFKPKLQYVPTVAIDGKKDKAAEDDLIGEICKLRPSLCNSQFNIKTNHILQ